MSESRRVAYRGAQVAGLAACALFLVAASGPWAVMATSGAPARPLWQVGSMAVVGVVVAAAGALALTAGFGPTRGAAEAAGLAVLAAAGVVFGTGLAFLALTRTGARAVLPTTIQIAPVPTPRVLVGQSSFPVAGRLLVVATGTVVVLAAVLAVRGRPGTRYGDTRPGPAAEIPGPVGAAVAVVGAAAVLVGASVLPWRASTFADSPTVWASGSAVTAGAVLVIAAGVGAAVTLRLAPARTSWTALVAVLLTLAGAAGGALLVADRLPGVLVGSRYGVTVLRESSPLLEVLAADVAVYGGTTLVVAACLVLFLRAGAPAPEDAVVGA